jgi:hypothetical protein
MNKLLDSTFSSFSFSDFGVKKMDKIDQLRKEIAKREVELADLRSQLAAAEADGREDKQAWKWPLDTHEYERYSRQMIVPKFGLEGMHIPQSLHQGMLLTWFKAS